MKQALLLSGGMDSIALAAWKNPAHAITVDYGQLPAAGEVRAARKVCQVLGIEHHVIRVDCRELGSGQLAGSSASAFAPVPEWWPFRNQLLVTLAVMKALAMGASELLCGSVKSDSLHVDGTAQFYRNLHELVSMQEGGVRVLAPAIELSTVELLRTAAVPRSLLAWSHSCHVDEFACGRCRGCLKSIHVLKELGYGDEFV